MSADALKRIGVANGWVAERWHLKLADALSREMGEMGAALTVFGVFGTAVLRNGYECLGEDRFGKILHLSNRDKRARAETYLAQLSQIVGAPVTLSQAAPVAKKGHDPEFDRQCRARVERLKVKTTNKGVLL